MQELIQVAVSFFELNSTQIRQLKGLKKSFQYNKK